MSAEQIAKLSQGQIECLLLVDRHSSTKEIASQLGISPHTVDQRIRGALEMLGVERRGESVGDPPHLSGRAGRDDVVEHYSLLSQSFRRSDSGSSTTSTVSSRRRVAPWAYTACSVWGARSLQSSLCRPSAGLLLCRLFPSV